MKGTLIVFEGTDGSGKATQTERLFRRLLAEGRTVRRLTFPRYDQDSSMLVRLYLGGAFGSRPGDVNAYAASTFYAVDRYASYKQDWGAYYEQGGLLVTDRYTTSNAVHQAGKLPPGERDAYLDWLFHFEYTLLGLPEPDLVLYLDLPWELSARLLRERAERTGAKADIHEADPDYLRRCRENAHEVVRRSGWRTVDCQRDGVLRSVEDIHEEIYELAVGLLREKERGDT